MILNYDLIIAAFFLKISYYQNLLANGGFEDLNSCYELKQIVPLPPGLL